MYQEAAETVSEITKSIRTNFFILFGILLLAAILCILLTVATETVRECYNILSFDFYCYNKTKRCIKLIGKKVCI